MLDNSPFLKKILFIFWLYWVFLACGLSLVAVSGGYSSVWCAGFLLQSTGSSFVGSVVVACRL